MAYVRPWMLSILPRRGRLQRTVYTSKITFKSSLVPEGAVGSSYARARNPELSKSWTLRDKIIVPDECRSPRVTSPVMLIIERWYFCSTIPPIRVQTIISLMKTRWLYSIHEGLMFPRQLMIAFSPGWIIKTCIIALHSIQKTRSISIDMEHYAKK